MGAPSILVGRGPLVSAPNAIVIDYGRNTLWHNGRRYHPTTTTGGTVQTHTTTVTFRVVAVVLSGMTGLIPYGDLIEALWGDDEEGGPASWRNYLASTMNRWMPTLDDLGIWVHAIHRQGLFVEYIGPDGIAEVQKRRITRATHRVGRPARTSFPHRLEHHAPAT